MVQFQVAECRFICGGRLGALVAEAESIYCGRPEASATEDRKHLTRKEFRGDDKIRGRRCGFFENGYTYSRI